MPQWLKQHPYQLELPGYNLLKDYETTSGDETIAIRGFLEGLQNPAPFLDTDTLQIRAFTEFEGKPYQQTLTLTEACAIRTVSRLCACRCTRKGYGGSQDTARHVPSKNGNGYPRKRNTA